MTHAVADRLAVIVPARDAERFVADAIASLLRQRHDAALDIIVVDDGSRDATADIVEAVAADAPEVRLVRQPQSGIAAARNTGLAAVSPEADFISFLDADDLSPAGRFARDLMSFRADPELELHYGTSRVFRDERRGLLEPDPQTPYVDVRNIQLGNLLLRASLARRVGRFNESFTVSDDVDYLFRALELGPKLVFVDDITVFYRRHGGNATRTGEVSTPEFARAVMMAARRRRAGGFPAPAGFFNARDTLEKLEWW